MRRLAVAATVAVVGAGFAVVASAAPAAPVSTPGFLDCYNGFTGSPLDGGVRLECEQDPTVPSTAPPTSAPPTTTVAPTTTAAFTTTLPPVTTTTTQPRPGVQFAETFDAPASLDRFRFQVMNGQVPATATSPYPSWNGDHDLACGAVDTSRVVRRAPVDSTGITFDPGEQVYWCRDHLMTSMRTTGYGQVNFAPDRTFDDVRRVCWDQNMTELGRKWTQVVIVPESIYQANGQRLDYITPTLQNDVAVRGLRISGGTFLLSFLRGSTEVFVGQNGYDVNFAGFTTQDKATRYRNCMTDNGNGTISFELQRAGFTDRRTLRGSFPDGPVRVIFQDDTYDADKDAPQRPANPYTWHWDNIVVE